MRRGGEKPYGGWEGGGEWSNLDVHQIAKKQMNLCSLLKLNYPYKTIRYQNHNSIYIVLILYIGAGIFIDYILV